MTALPLLTEARAPLTAEVAAHDERGQPMRVSLPAERALTIYVDKRELLTLMTLGQHPEWLVLGHLLNQRLVDGVGDIASITVDWDVDAAAVRTRHGITDWVEKTAQRTVTTGCGQGSVFGQWWDVVERIDLGEATLTQRELYAIVDAMRVQDSTYKSAGSVHGCALFVGGQMRCFVEDVGRHNAIDTIAGWMVLNGVSGHDAVFYTTGRLTSEMILKAAQMGVPIVVSRSGMTAMGHRLAERLGLCAIGRALNQRFICYSAPHRLLWQADVLKSTA